MVVDVQPLRSSHEIAEFREAIQVSSSEAYRKRNLLLFSIGINTGLRISDIVGLRIEDLRGQSYFIVYEGKTTKRRTVHVPHLMADIADYLDDMDDRGWVFPSRVGDGHITTTQAYRILAKAADFIGRKDIGTHSLRKTFGYHYYKKFNNIAELMEIFNHSSQSITKKYIGIRDEEIADRMRDLKL